MEGKLYTAALSVPVRVIGQQKAARFANELFKITRKASTPST